MGKLLRASLRALNVGFAQGGVTPNDHVGLY